MKFKSLLFAVIATAFLSSSMSTDSLLKEGSNAPEIVRVNGAKLNVKDGENSKMISFWSPKDPSSRILNKQLSDKCQSENIEFISICTDTDEVLGKEVIKYDGIAGTHLAYSEVDQRIFKDYDVTGSSAAYMISADGKVMKVIR